MNDDGEGRRQERKNYSVRSIDSGRQEKETGEIRTEGEIREIRRELE